MAQTKIYKNVNTCIENEMRNCLKSWAICQLFQMLNNETWLIMLPFQLVDIWQSCLTLLTFQEGINILKFAHLRHMVITKH